MEKQIKKITIFDFDGTLVDSPLPDTGKGIFEKATNTVWPHKGWWGRVETLDQSIFDIPLVDSVKIDYDAVKDDTSVYKVMLTGRLSKLSNEVEKVLKSHDLEFDEYHYNTGGATEVVKMRVMSKLITKFPNVEIHLIDDRLEHIPIFEEYLQRKVDEGKLKSFIITVVPANRH
jgi:hypothetical protein|tara:strand:- start:18609 stop:19130 length:522 start_codon:yes stop_codon:yes gene_type:complete